jgi:hypothetical protein
MSRLSGSRSRSTDQRRRKIASINHRGHVLVHRPEQADPEFISALHYYTAVSEWFDRLSLDDQERVRTVVYVYSRPATAARSSGSLRRVPAVRATSDHPQSVGVRLMPAPRCSP